MSGIKIFRLVFTCSVGTVGHQTTQGIRAGESLHSLIITTQVHSFNLVWSRERSKGKGCVFVWERKCWITRNGNQTPMKDNNPKKHSFVCYYPAFSLSSKLYLSSSLLHHPSDPKPKKNLDENFKKSQFQPRTQGFLFSNKSPQVIKNFLHMVYSINRE